MASLKNFNIFLIVTAIYAYIPASTIGWYIFGMLSGFCLLGYLYTCISNIPYFEMIFAFLVKNIFKFSKKISVSSNVKIFSEKEEPRLSPKIYLPKEPLTEVKEEKIIPVKKESPPKDVGHIPSTDSACIAHHDSISVFPPFNIQAKCTNCKSVTFCTEYAFIGIFQCVECFKLVNYKNSSPNCKICEMSKVLLKKTIDVENLNRMLRKSSEKAENSEEIVTCKTIETIPIEMVKNICQTCKGPSPHPVCIGCWKAYGRHYSSS